MKTCRLSLKRLEKRVATMNDQSELFPATQYVDLSHGMTARSTRRKQLPTKSDRAPIQPLPENKHDDAYKSLDI